MRLTTFLPHMICLIVLVIATITDLRIRRIPNMLTIPFLLGGLLSGCILVPGMRVEKTIFVLLCFLAGLFPGLGLGDIKLLMCIGLWNNPILALFELAAASIGVLLVQFIRRPLLTQIQILHGLKHPFLTKENIPKTRDNTVPFAPYLLAAYILVEGGIYLWHTL